MQPVKMANTTEEEEVSGAVEQGATSDEGTHGDGPGEAQSGSIEVHRGSVETRAASEAEWMQRDSGFPFRSDTISRYRLIMRLGRGGMARVYLACTRTGLSKLVVLKVLEPHLTKDESARVAFHKEATLSALMSHPNVVQVHEVFEAEGTPVMVMEYLEGWSLSEVLKVTRCGLPLRMNLMILGQVLNALHYVHEMTDLEGKPLGAVHRDVSPNNIMILPSGFAKVLDFGIAKATIEGSAATETGIIKGKLRYMAPEQLLGAPLDRRVDVFAAGVILWEMLAQQRMWSKVPDSQVVGALAHGVVPELPHDIEVPAPLRDAVKRATAKSPKDRFETAQEFAQVLSWTAAELGPPPSSSEVKAHLGEELDSVIRERRELIKQAMKDSSSTGPVSLDDLPFVEAASQSSSSKLSLPGHDRSVTAPSGGLSASSSGELMYSPPSSRRWRLAALGLGVLLIGGLVAFTQLREPTAADAQSRAAASVPQSIRVAALPEDATIFVNDVQQATNPAEIVPPSGSWRLKVVSSGYQPFEREYTRLPGSPISVHLERLAAKEAAPSASATTEAATPPQKAINAPRAWRQRAAPSPPPKQQAAKQPAPEQPTPNCSPPYYYDAEGTKIFRKECF
ncbi:MAG: protein kinase [Myxococcales bacterium]|nr:protein kinase [Myxococcales bacterium]